MTDEVPTIHERLGRIEASLEHVVHSVDKAEEYRSSTIQRISSVEEKVALIESQLPQLEQNTKAFAKEQGIKEQRIREHADDKALRAWIVAILALIVSTGSAIMKWIIDG